jgi:hypothetical protein
VQIHTWIDLTYKKKKSRIVGPVESVIPPIPSAETPTTKVRKPSRRARGHSNNPSDISSRNSSSLTFLCPTRTTKTETQKKRTLGVSLFFSCLCFPSLEGHRLGTQPSPLHKSETSKILCKTRAVETAERELRTPSAHGSSKHSE